MSEREKIERLIKASQEFEEAYKELIEIDVSHLEIKDGKKQRISAMKSFKDSNLGGVITVERWLKEILEEEKACWLFST